jgi:transaldolase
MNPITKLTTLGQSIWYDNIQRKLLTNGTLANLIANGDIRGITSNPSIFHNAIAKTTDYDAALLPMVSAGWNAETIFWQLAKEDIQAAADLFKSLYHESNAGDGYVSLEVNPNLANDTEGTVAQAKKLWNEVNRPNLMIKIPATKAGIPAITQVIAAGINVNVTLIFSLSRYEEVMEAFMLGLELRHKQGLSIENIASVASFFISRVDSKIDGILQGMIQNGGSQSATATHLLGKAAIANAKQAYTLFEKKFSGYRFKELQAKGAARRQRPLWASTSTKNPAYRDVVYIEELIGPETVNTVPPQTLDAFRDHGIASLTIHSQLEEAQKSLEALNALGISMDKVTNELEQEGVKAFQDAFAALIKTIDERRLAALTANGQSVVEKK